MFGRVWDVHRALWAFERKAHGGPVFGEGNSHWYWSGCLDGVEAQFGTGWPWAQGPSAPLAVDFDLLRIHPLQINHGMGYYERWDPKIGYGRIMPMVMLDQYRMQEIAYGHTGFLSATTWSVAPLAWLEHHLMTPVSERYATARVVGIRYQINGKWVSSTRAAKAGVWDRVEVRYSNGLTVTANNAKEPMSIAGHTLPRFGWLARGAGVTAYTALGGGKLVDYAETKDSIFLDWETAIKPEVRDPAREALYKADLNELAGAVDFGTVRTDGSILLRREGDEWVLRALPRDADRVVELSAKRFPMPKIITCVGGTAPTVEPTPAGSFWRLPLRGAKEYRWKAE
jgi:hypothetical protein